MAGRKHKRGSEGTLGGPDRSRRSITWEPRSYAATSARKATILAQGMGKRG